jgi:hypothetical protein
VALAVTLPQLLAKNNNHKGHGRLDEKSPVIPGFFVCP